VPVRSIAAGEVEMTAAVVVAVAAILSKGTAVLVDVGKVLVVTLSRD
jgi:hypothetical protein